MSDAPIQTLRLAFFGQSGSGKTSLVSSYFGYQQRHAFEQKHGYRLSAVDTREGNLLLRNYYGMQDGAFPVPTVARSSHFHFDLRVSKLSRPALRLEWIDYPGGWWGHEPADEEERQRQRACIKSLLTAQVGFLIVDGAQFQKDGLSYLRELLRDFTGEVKRWQRVISAESGLHQTVIEEWVIALTKADQFPLDYTAEKFCREVITGAVEELNELGKALHGEPRSFGTRYMLLSAAQAEQGNRQRVQTVDKTIGLELIAPAALLLPLSRLAKQRQEYNPRSDLPWWQRIFITAAEVVSGGDLQKRVGPRYSPLVALIQLIGTLTNIDAQKKADALLQKKAQAVQEGDALKATAIVMKEQLTSKSAQQAFFVSQDDE